MPALSQQLRIPDFRGADLFTGALLNGVAGPDELEVMETAFGQRPELRDLAELLLGLRTQKVGGVDLEVQSALRAQLAGVVQRDARLIEATIVELQRRSVAFSTFDRATAKARLLQALRERGEGAPIRSFEDRLAGPTWRHSVLPMAAGEIVGQGRDGFLFERFLDILDSRFHTAPQKILILRFLGDHIRDLSSNLDSYLTALEELANIIGDDIADPALKEMALALLHQFENVEGFFQKAGSLFQNPRSARPSLLGRTQPLSLGELGFYRERIERLAPIILAQRAMSLPKGPRSWYDATPSLLGLEEMNTKDLLAKAREIFSDTEEQIWRRGLALAFYSYSFIPDEKRILSLEEAEEVCGELLTIVRAYPENHVLHQMAVAIFPRVVVNQIGAGAGSDKKRIKEKIRAWADRKADQLASVGTTLAMVKAAKIKKVSIAKLGPAEPTAPVSTPSGWTLFGHSGQLLSALRRRLHR